MFRLLCACTALLAFGAVTAPVYARASHPPPAVVRAMTRTAVPAEHVSIYVRDAATDQVLVDAAADAPRTPASVIKVLTTFAALDILGPGYTWKTRALANGRMVNGVLEGDLILVGGGDPYITSDRWWSFVQHLRERGLKKITGDIVIDNSYFAPGSGDRADFDGQAFRSYNVLPDALMVNFQTTRFTITTQAGSGKPQVVLNPAPANLVVNNQLRLGSGRCSGYQRGVRFEQSEAAPDVISVSGVFPAACGVFSINRAVMTAPEYAYGTFRTLWMESGGEIGGDLRLGVAPSDASLLFEYESPPLPEIIRLVNKFSNNVMARHLLLTLGAEKYGAPATLESGRNAMRAWLLQRGLPVSDFVLDNGSGLSRLERVTARGLGEMLDLAWHSPFMPEFAASLPLAATDGTLRNRFDAPGMQGRIRLKTGRIDDVSALAGYVNAASGRTFIVVIIVNHPGAHTGGAEAVQSELIRWVFAQ